ncbi:MAG: hypothetical protein JRI68_08515 [Deltaproteobacteria bacterium]|nr:hypothetical protein [Deltaproteobacteria bacterium]
MIAAACATGGGNNDDGNGTGGSTSSTGSGGEGGIAGGGGSGGIGGTTSGTGGTEPPCEEDPCKLVPPQCGCDPVEKCALNPADGTRSCIADGTVDVGDECSANCKAGGLCLTWSSFSQCFKYCATDDDCSGFGSICIMQLQDYPERFCSVNCDPPSGNGCDVAGTKCEALYSQDDLKWFTLCAMAGTGTQLADCATNGLQDCADGYGCFNDGNQDVCLQYCNMDSPSCAAGTCQDISNPIMIGSAHYGVCF